MNMMKKGALAVCFVAAGAAFVACNQKDKAAEAVQMASDVAAAVAGDSSQVKTTIDSLSTLPVAEKLGAYEKYVAEFAPVVKELKAGNTSVLADFQKYTTVLQELGTQLQNDAKSLTPEQQKKFQELYVKATELLKN